MTKAQHDRLSSLSPRVLSLLGPVDLTVQAHHGRSLGKQISAALGGDTFQICRNTSVSLEISQARSAPKGAGFDLTVKDALRMLGTDLQSLNWVLLEPTKLALQSAGCGGLAELKDALPADKVMFGALRFSFPRGDYAPPIVKHMFLHWIGPRVSAVRRGQWNSKLEEAVSTMRTACDFAFRKTAYGLEDLVLQNLIEELDRVTCATCSDTRQFSAEWYLEGLRAAKEGDLEQLPATNYATTIDSATLHATDEATDGLLMSKGTQCAIAKVREEGSQWTWVALQAYDRKDAASGGA